VASDQAVFNRQNPLKVNSTCRHAQLRKEIFGQESGRLDREIDLKKILSMPKLSVKAAKFMLHTRLLGQFKAVEKGETT
jgi:hypothetical protein